MLRRVGLGVGEALPRSVVNSRFVKPPRQNTNGGLLALRHLNRPVGSSRCTTTPSSPLSRSHHVLIAKPHNPTLLHPLRHANFSMISQPEPSKLRRLVFSAWRRSAHTKSKRRIPAGEARNKSSVTYGTKKAAIAPSAGAPKAELSPGLKATSKIPIPTESQATEGQSLYDRLPHLPHIHRPTKEELLAAATGFWSKIKIHFKWVSIRDFRHFNREDFAAFLSWIFIGHLVWVVVGTTTFFSLVLFMVNTVSAQETLARWIGNYLTQSSGIHVIFESAIVPKWKDGVISFKNVFVSRRPGKKAKVTKGSQTTAIAAAAAAAANAEIAQVDDDDDGNYTQFDITIDTVDVTLSLARWFNGRGLLRDVELTGVRGVIDRTNIKHPAEYVDPRIYKHTHIPGDFELDSFKMEDLLVTIYQPKNFRPFSVSIFNCDLPRLRKHWLFYDFLSANNISGSYDNSLFTIHPRQTHNYTGAKLREGRESGDEISQWKKHSRVRMDGLNIDHLNTGVEGPFGWIHEGNVDIVADIMFPSDDGDSIAKVVSDFYDRVEASVIAGGREVNDAFNRATLPADAGREGPTLTSTTLHHDESVTESQQLPTSPNLTSPNHQTPEQPPTPPQPQPFLVMDLRMHLNNVHASVPLYTPSLGYLTPTLIRPIVSYINTHGRTFIPLSCRVLKPLPDFNGSWTVYDSGLVEDVSQEVYEAFARDVRDDEGKRRRRFKKVGFWTLQLAAQALFVGLAGNIA